MNKKTKRIVLIFVLALVAIMVFSFILLPLMS
jgi:hypothetical protein